MGDQPIFAIHFYNIEGDTVNERKKNFFKLLSNTQFPNEQQLESELTNLKPITYQQNLFYIDTLIHFKRTKELLEILKQGNEVYISKILKQGWLVGSAFDNMDIVKFVYEFLPCLSFSMRKKLLNKISKCWPEEKMDVLFDAVNKKYGYAVSTAILHKCSVSKIKSELEENEILFRPNQVLNIYKKSEELFEFYLMHFNKITHTIYEEDKVIHKVACKNPELLLSLEKKGQIKLFKIGRRTSKNMVTIAKDDIPKDSERYLKFLNKSVLIKKLGNNFLPIYKQLFPRNFLQLNAYCSSVRLLQYYPKNARWNLFQKTCNEIFPNKSLYDIVLKFRSLQTLNPPKEITLKWAEAHYDQQERNFTEFLKYYEPSKAVPLIKDKINVSSNITERKSLLCLLISVCKENNDLNTLEEVLKYICFRHRNEDSFIRCDLLSKLSNDFDLGDFNENHWKYIDEQIKILKITKDFHLYNFRNLVEKHLEFLFKTGKNYKIVLSEFMNDIVDQKDFKLMDLDDLSLVKRIYIEMAKLIPEVFKDSPTYRSIQTKFLTMFIKFSIKKPDYCLNLRDFPELISLTQSSFAKNENFDRDDKDIIEKVIDYNLKFPSTAIPHGANNIITIIQQVVKEEESLSRFEYTLTSVLTKKERGVFGNEIFNTYFDKLVETYPIRGIIKWYMRNEPRTLSPYISQIIKTALDTSELLDYKLIKQYSHLGFDRKVIEIFMEKITDGRDLFDPLCVLLPTEDYVNLINERYLPKKDKIDVNDKEMKELFNIQCKILKTMTKVTEPYKLLPAVMKYCKGDFLQPALRALYSVFYRSPEKMLYSYAQLLSKQAVSARKHAIFLSCAVLDKEHTLNMLENTIENNVSSRKHQFSATLKYFLKNPSEDLLDRVINSFDNIDKNDRETLDMLKDFVVPTKFRSKYIESCWEFFKGLEAKGVKNKDYLESLLKKMHEEELLESLSSEFLIDNIKREFPVVENRLSNLDSFVMRVLRYRVSGRNEYFGAVFDLLSKLPKKIANNFFSAFFKEADETVDDAFLQIFLSYWEKTFDIIDSFDNTVCLKLIISKRQGLEAWVSFIVNYLEQLIDQFGYFAYNHFKEQFDLVLSSSMNEIEKYAVYLKILRCKLTATNCVLVLEFIRHIDEVEEEELWKSYKEIRSILEKVDIPIVRVNYSNFISDQVV
ncbi:uncharacterized protein LOC130446483 [Diorhabda sublineata]|uniref:uncharacterized protein LOC130446483 n=1 Tax=Diorhabda sublineata TaxID=1163346 RepID=UPI0024E0B17A|nr:uncharacterized protein LOC130446483 [Diorhabda sublineata]